MRWRIRFANAILLPELSPKDAYELRHQVIDEGALTQGYVLMCALSAGIATLGLLQSSTAVVIGAMLISPLMSPIAALGFGFASIDGQRIRNAAKVVLVGALIGVATGMLLTLISPIRTATPEILARTEPTLLDLAVALLSGIAGGYATVLGKGGTAIGVAIATALMPPLATVGYGLGVMNPAYALGAFLLFLTNLSAIAFAFALIARLSGSARPITNVEWKPRYIIAGLAAFFVLATPLAFTLMRVSEEASLRSAARSAIADAIGSNTLSIAQLDIDWPLFGSPQVHAVVVTPRFKEGAEDIVRNLLSHQDREATILLQQIVAADTPSQTRTMIDAALERAAAGIAADAPPVDRIRASIAIPTRGIWTNQADRVVNVEPMAAPDWTLTDYRHAERVANTSSEGWQIRVIPPVTARLLVGHGEAPIAKDTVPTDVAIWAIQRWGMKQVGLAMPPEQAADALISAFENAGISTRPLLVETVDAGTAIIEIVGPPPTTTQP
jgi:uncharacterized hydrophobic protein (TIGR00271 family)